MSTTTRRHFLKTASAGAVALSMSAASRARAQGANERLSIGLIGCGDRGVGAHMVGIHPYDQDQNIEVTAVCDPWRLARERAAAQAKEWYGREPRQFVSYRDLLALDDIDAVMIASCDHQHTAHLEAAAKAQKDVYCEKPLAMDFEKLKRACDAVRENKVVCQIGTQLRSLASMTACRELYKTGILGTVGRIEQCRNGSEPYWYSRVKDVKEEDVDWQEFLMDRPMRPFDPVQYSGWYGYRDFSDGPVPGLGSHYIDLVHYITGAQFPTSAVCLGGTYTWKDDYKFTCPDHVQALWTYPEGFMVSYSTNFGSSWANSFKFLGDVGAIDLVNWNDPILSADGGSKNKGAIRGQTHVTPVERPDHFLDWLQCIRSRGVCNADIEAGYQHAVAVIMAMRAFDTGRRQVYDVEKREIREG
ncbi:MAG TPA: Gfo/Idh/MocA family oxidoreductase [Candidatus Hydrogenedentes bacterium]|nr:Gfo/Idh/MocA family oxidoreductase [Candidatus Hydrogenedentota bacterium]HPG67256.1 Gfo/Idh/MocA family oxidoreductase [Candidatus Hydrogenedentota bacterium]